MIALDRPLKMWPKCNLQRGIHLAQRFLEDHPDAKPGVWHGGFYDYPDGEGYVVYLGKGGTVVVRRTWQTLDEAVADKDRGVREAAA